ncbi:MAG TPA: phosphoribosyltransferase family protein [Lacunisphaera sp.]|nr:phosphoribosyltransferase family protein [Lacunisphaera sp.]
MQEEVLLRTVNGTRALQISAYPDGMPLVKDELPSDAPFKALVRPRSLASFMAFLFWYDALGERGGAGIDLVLPFVPGARQDRLNPRGDFLFTVKSVAELLNSRGFNRITVLDPHSEVTPALIDRCHVVSAADCIDPPVGKYAAVVSPDAGAEKRASAVAKKLGVPILHAWKLRDLTTGELTGFGMEPTHLPLDSLVLVVDDICDGGGTFIGLADELDRAGLKAHLWVTHGIFSKGTAPLLARFRHVYCTDSVDGPRDGIIEIPVCKRLLGDFHA